MKAKRISVAEALALFESNSNREDVLLMDKNYSPHEHPVALVERFSNGGYLFRLMTNADVKYPAQAASAQLLVQLPEGVSYWDDGYEKYL